MSIISIEEILTALVIQDMQSTERAVQLLGPLLLQKNIRKLKWYPIIRILLYLRNIESKEKNYEESIK